MLYPTRPDGLFVKLMAI